MTHQYFKSFINSPTDELVRCLKNSIKIYIKVYIKTATTCFGVTVTPSSADGLARGGTALRFLGLKPALWVSRRDLQKRLGRWLANQHGAQWRGLGDTQRQTQEFISEPSLGTRAKFVTFNRIQSRVETGLLTGHNTLRRHLHLLGLLDSPFCRKCGAEGESSAHTLCECEALGSLRNAYLSSFFLESEDIRRLGLGPSGTIVRFRGSHDSIWSTKGPS